MCTSKPDMPAAAAPAPAGQEAKAPDAQASAQATYNKRKPNKPVGTLLTGNDGVMGATVGKTSLLGD